MTEDSELLRLYAENRDEGAFCELLRRHVDFVYSSAQRMVCGDDHLADEVCQDVFLQVAQKAGKLRWHPVLKSWLYTAAQYSAANSVRAAQRRRAREQEAFRMQELETDGPGREQCIELGALIDSALKSLAEADRAAILLRFFEDRSFADVGRRLGLTEDAARKRTDRAVDKLTQWLAAQGVRTTGQAIAVCFAEQATFAAPATLVPQIVSSVQAAAATGILAAGSAAWWHLLTMSQLKLVATVTLGLVLVAGLGFQYRANAELGARRDVLAARTVNFADLQAERSRLRLARGEAQAALADKTALARLKVAAISAPSPDIAIQSLGSTLVPVESLQNRGNATPEAAFETMYWARINRDYATIEKLIGTVAEERFPAEGPMGGVPPEKRAQFPGASPGRLMEIAFEALTPEQRAVYPEAFTAVQFFARDWVEDGDRELSLSLNTVTTIDADHIYLSGQRKIEAGVRSTDIVLQRTTEGWKWYPRYGWLGGAMAPGGR